MSKFYLVSFLITYIVHNGGLAGIPLFNKIVRCKMVKQILGTYIFAFLLSSI